MGAWVFMFSRVHVFSPARLEVMKISNLVGGLDGMFSVDGSKIVDKSSSLSSSKKKVLTSIGFAIAAGALMGLVDVLTKWSKRPKGQEKRNNLSSWLLPLHTSHSSFTTSRGGSHHFDFQKSGYTNFYYLSLVLVKFFTFFELQEAEKVVVGVGGFGKVHLGDLEDGTKVDVRRVNNGRNGEREQDTILETASSFSLFGS